METNSMQNALTFLYWFLAIVALLFAVGIALLLIGAGMSEKDDVESKDVDAMRHKDEPNT